MPVHSYATRRATALRAQSSLPTSPLPQRPSTLAPPKLESISQQPTSRSPLLSHSSALPTRSMNAMKMEEQWNSRKRLRSDMDDEKNGVTQDRLQEEDSDNESVFAPSALSPLLSSEPSSPLDLSAISSSPHPFTLSFPNSPRSGSLSPFPSSSACSSSSSPYSSYFLSEHSQLSSSAGTRTDDAEKQPRKRPRLYVHIPEDDAPSTWTQKYQPLPELSNTDRKVEFAGLPCFDEDEKNDSGMTEDAIIGPYTLKDYQDPTHDSRMEAFNSFPSMPSEESPPPLVCSTPPMGASSAAALPASQSLDIFSQYDWVIAASFPPVDINSTPVASSSASLSSSSSSLSMQSTLENFHGFEVVRSELDGIEHHSWRTKQAERTLLQS